MQTNVFYTLTNGGQEPKKGTEGAAGYDLYVQHVSVDIATASATVHTGLRTAFQQDVVMLLFARSGLATKYGLVPANGVGVVDSDYRGEVMVKFNNLTPLALNHLLSMGPGDRIAQVVFVPVLSAKFIEVESLEDSDRGENGFGSTGA